jgi:peptidoglycan-N-acetylglucosamine deacetylase
LRAKSNKLRAPLPLTDPAGQNRELPMKCTIALLLVLGICSSPSLRAQEAEDLLEAVPCDDGNFATTDDTLIDGVCIGMLDADGDEVLNYGYKSRCTGKGSLDNCLDNCPLIANPDQQDSNSDGLGDACSEARLWYRFETKAKVVAITFDDGWSDGALNDILDALQENNALATFFINCKYITEHALKKKTLLRLVKEGHLMGNHTSNHTIGNAPVDAERELLSCEKMFQEQLGITLRPVFRSPAYAESMWLNTVLEKTGFTANFRASIDPNDWKNPPPPAEAMAKCMSEETEPGDVLLFHIGPTSTPYAVSLILKKLKLQGFEFLTLEQMVHYGAPTDDVPDSGAKQCGRYYD